MKDLKRRVNGRGFAAAALALVALVLSQPSETRAQWTTGTNINNTNAGTVGVGTSGTTARGSYTDLLIGPGPVSPNNPQIEFFGPAKSTAIQYDESAGGLVFYTNGPTWMQTLFAGNNGNVGVGTTSPANALHVKNASGFGFLRVSGVNLGAVNFEDTNAPQDQKIYQWRSEGGRFRMSLANDGNTSLVRQNILVVNPSGNVGVGTETPTARLDISGGYLHVSGVCGGALPNTQGAYLSWNQNCGTGETDLINHQGAGAGGFAFMNTQNGSALTTLVSISGGGDLTVSGAINAKYQDVAEWVPSARRLSAGTVVVLDPERTNHVVSSTKSYDTRVAGVVSDSPGVILGVAGEGKLKVSTTGRVKVRVDAARSPIKVGDLLVTSDVEGVAMKSVEVDLGGVKIHRPGTIIGKALEPLDKGTGEILVLLSLQ